MRLMLVVWRYILYQCVNKDISHMSRYHRYLGICEISLWSYGFPVNFSDETFNRLFKPIEISSVWLAPVADYNVDKIKKMILYLIIKHSMLFQSTWRVLMVWQLTQKNFMMTSSNGNIFRVTGHLCGEFTGPRWIPHTKVSDAELWCFLWSASE